MVFRRVFALMLAVASFGAVAAAPLLTLQSIPTARCITPSQILYEKHINADGTIEARNLREVYLDTPVIASEVQVSVGDYVKSGQQLATINTELTRSVLSQSIPTSELMENLPSAEETQQLLGLYSAFQSAGLASDLPGMGDLAEVFGGFSTPTQQQNDYLYIPQTVTAPISGIVTALSLQSDVLSRTAQPAVVISDVSSFVAKVSVGETYVSDLRLGDPATIEGAGFTHTYTGHISKIYPTARKSGGTNAQETVVDLEITIDDPDETLKSGFTARAEITTDTQREILIVPYEAVQQDENNQEYVYLLNGTQTTRRTIETGMELLEGIEVCEGLEASDVILSNASDGLSGRLVQLVGGEENVF